MSIVLGSCVYQKELNAIRDSAKTAPGMTQLPPALQTIVMDYAVEPSRCMTVSRLEKNVNQTVDVVMGFLSRCGFTKQDKVILHADWTAHYQQKETIDKLSDLEALRKICLAVWRDTLFKPDRYVSASSNVYKRLREVPEDFKDKICFHAIVLSATFAKATTPKYGPCVQLSPPDIAQEKEEALREQIQVDLGGVAKDLLASAPATLMPERS